MQKNNIITTELGNIKFKSDLLGLCTATDKTLSLPHSHANFEFHIITKSSATLDIEDKSITLYQNDAVLLFPGSFHKFSHQDENFSILNFSFFMEENITRSGDHFSVLSENLDKESGYLIIRQNTLLCDYIKKIVTNLNLKNPFSGDIVKSLLILVFSEIFLPYCSKAPSSYDIQSEISEHDSRVFMIENYFNDHYFEDISLAKLSKLLCLSEMQTNRIIKKAFKTDFRNCLSDIRLKSAKKFLRETDQSVKDIAEAVGYQSYNGFYLAFKSKFGITPLEYRAKNRSNKN